MMFLLIIMNWHLEHPPQVNVPHRLQGSPLTSPVYSLVTNLSLRDLVRLKVIRGSFVMNWFCVGSIRRMCQCFCRILLMAFRSLLKVVMILVYVRWRLWDPLHDIPKSRLCLFFSLALLKAFFRVMGGYPHRSNLDCNFLASMRNMFSSEQFLRILRYCV